MPKLVTQAQIRRWRELLSEGKDYKEIGLITGWQDRTVRKHLESDIRSSDATQIRRELFKERLGQHWDMLLEKVLSSLDTLKPMPARQGLEYWISSQAPSQDTLAEVLVARDAKGVLSVEAPARHLVEWPLLRDHLLRDSLWQTASEWEEAYSNDLVARSELYNATRHHLTRECGDLPVVDRTRDTPALTRRAIYEVFIEGFVRALGMPERNIDDRSVLENPNGAQEVLGVPNAAFGLGLRERLLAAVRSGVDLWSTFPEKERWAVRYQAVEGATKELKRTITHLRLLQYLPGVCSVCSRFDV